MERQPAPTKHESERPSIHQCRGGDLMRKGRAASKHRSQPTMDGKYPLTVQYANELQYYNRHKIDTGWLPATY